MLMRIGLRGPSNNTANATLGVILSGITTANGTFLSIRQGSEEKNGTSACIFLKGARDAAASVKSAPGTSSPLEKLPKGLRAQHTHLIDHAVPGLMNYVRNYPESRHFERRSDVAE
jgi:hypothetical protein